MKLLVLSILATAGLVARIDGTTIKRNEIENIFRNEAKKSYDIFMQSFEEFTPIVNLIKQELQALLPQNVQPGIRVPIIPPGLLPDPLALPNLVLTDMDFLGLIKGDLSFLNNKLKGLKNWTDDFLTGPGPVPGEPGASLSYSVGIPELLLDGEYDADLNFASLGSPVAVALVGAGPSSFYLKGTSVYFKMNLVQKEGAPEKPQLEVQFAFGLDSFVLKFENTTINGHQFDDWEPFSEFFSDILPIILPIVNGIASELITVLMNLVVQECSFQELYDFMTGVADGLPCLAPSTPGPTPGPTPALTNTEEPQNPSEPTTESSTPYSAVINKPLEILAIIALSYRVLN